MKGLLATLRSEAKAVATWNRIRSMTELRQFVEVHHAALPTDIDIE